MGDLPANPYVEAHGGTRISLDSIAYAVRRNETVTEIHADFPAIESRQLLESAVAFVQSHPPEVGTTMGLHHIWCPAGL